MNEIVHGDCLEILPTLNAESVDLVFADPPYFLSGGGTTCKGGKRASVDKGEWDVPTTPDEMHWFNRRWINDCIRVLRPGGAIWICGTFHNIGSCLFACQQLGLRILNLVTWKKPTPVPNLSCRMLTHSTEHLVWAARGHEPHHFDYVFARRDLGAGRQLKDLWEFGRPRADEYTYSRHPTQKPEALLERVLLASSRPDDLVVDPFGGSCTTAVVAKRTGRRYVVIEKDPMWVGIGRRRVAAVQGVQMDLLEAGR